jgi:hypothetical protein
VDEDVCIEDERFQDRYIVSKGEAYLESEATNSTGLSTVTGL